MENNQSSTTKIENPFARITVEDANKLPWSNDFMDEAMAISLFMRVFNERNDTSSFWKKKKEIELSFLSSNPKFPEIQAELRSAIGSDDIGTTREKTSQIFSIVLLTQINSMQKIGPKLLLNEFNRISLIAKDRVLKQVWVDFLEFQMRYRDEYQRKSLGGTAQFQNNIIDSSLADKAESAARILEDFPFISFLEYFQQLAHQCHNIHLKSWFVPALILLNDECVWAGRFNTTNNRQVSYDGFFGPIFPRHAEDIFKILENKDLSSEKILHEWELIAMTGDEARKYLGLFHARERD
jgi:hypothetical protein